MIKEFFLDKFEFDFRINQRWIETIAENEDSVSEYTLKSFSHIINVHHIWIQRLLQIPSESHTWDRLPIDFWLKLSQENHLKTIDFLEKHTMNESIHFIDDDGVRLEKDSIDVLYHILNHSNYHRAQIALDLRKTGIQPPSFNFIAFK